MNEAFIGRVTEIVSLAFANDPTWSPFASPGGVVTDDTRTYWDVFVRSAQRYPWTFMNEEETAAAVWFPPGATELTPEEEERLPQLATQLFGEEKAAELFQVYEQFEASTPKGDFFYLSLLGVDPAHAGQGLGLKLLRENLERIDALGVPTYLESSNPANDAKYMSVGYEPHGTFTLPSGLTLSTFWREAP